MNNEAKIRLSAFEKELVTNVEWIFAKQLIIEKVYLLFGGLNEDFKNIVNTEDNIMVPELQARNGKITKGENYKGLPYIILDYPAFFSKENIFAVRTLFWWGNYFSITFHLSGKSFRQMEKSSAVLAFLEKNNFSVCINENEWEHHFDETNYLKINKMDREQKEKIYEKSFFKIGQIISLQRWDEAGSFLRKNFKLILDLIALSFPTGETVL